MVEVRVELWRAPLDVEDELFAELTAALSPAERARGDARRTADDRRRFLVDHGWRRRLLGARTGCDPAALTFRAGEHGKPELSDPDGGSSDRSTAQATHRPPPRFSASRAGSTALYALCAVAEVGVGVDLEEIADAERPPSPRFADRLLAPAERVALDALDPAERARGLAEAWTRKEAYVKAVGSGLVFPLTALDLWRGDGAPVRRDDVEVHGLEVGADHAAAVAVGLGGCGTLQRPAGEVLWLHKSLPSF